MENQKRPEQPPSSTRRSLKRKLEGDFEEHSPKLAKVAPHQDLALEVRSQVEILDSASSSIEPDRASVKRSIRVLTVLAKNVVYGFDFGDLCGVEDVVNVIVESGAVPALVRQLEPLAQVKEGGAKLHDLEIERGCALTLGLLAIKVICLCLISLSKSLLEELSSYSSCSESQREAALLLGQFAASDIDCKVHIAQRGAVRPLIEMLQSKNIQLREMSAFALGRLAQDTHNQAGIAHTGGIVPLLKLLDSRNGSLQHNAAFALYGLADNEDNVADIVRVGGVQKLQDGEFVVQPTRDCVAKTLKRLEEKINGRVLNHLLYLMRVAEKGVQRRIALTLAHLCSPDDQKTIFIDNNGLDLLLELLVLDNLKHQRDGSVALYKLADKASSLSPVDAGPPSPISQVYLGEKYVNSPTLSDVTFLIEGKRFYAHRICLLASSDAFRAMFDGGYREKDAKDIEIPNIRWDVFEVMMRYIYTGSVDVTLDIAQDLLRAADQYLLEGLKRLCEYAIAQDISVENVSLMYELSEAFNAASLTQACVLFILENFDKLSPLPRYVTSFSSYKMQQIIRFWMI
ncbi:hypothetical protein RJ639_005026 [Escallonia herrerae]|uniref:BTB domain-containing protein n=1 Tax=Escallonia herrerae TaxID=1293975 RepID=A0AA89AZ89_9ASTE|nr:hypothetical protein RJ639_005026 [Escallonia herrerae]